MAWVAYRESTRLKFGFFKLYDFSGSVRLGIVGHLCSILIEPSDQG